VNIFGLSVMQELSILSLLQEGGRWEIGSVHECVPFLSRVIPDKSIFNEFYSLGAVPRAKDMSTSLPTKQVLLEFV
jgi:hypothetical protein